MKLLKILFVLTLGLGTTLAWAVEPDSTPTDTPATSAPDQPTVTEAIPTTGPCNGCNSNAENNNTSDGRVNKNVVPIVDSAYGPAPTAPDTTKAPDAHE